MKHREKLEQVSRILMELLQLEFVEIFDNPILGEYTVTMKSKTMGDNGSALKAGAIQAEVNFYEGVVGWLTVKDIVKFCCDGYTKEALKCIQSE